MTSIDVALATNAQTVATVSLMIHPDRTSVGVETGWTFRRFLRAASEAGFGMADPAPFYDGMHDSPDVYVTGWGDPVCAN